MPKITIKDGETFEAPAGKRLVLAIEDSGINILHRCGGYARCTTCLVKFHEGEPDKMTAEEHDRLNQEGGLGALRLSCQCTVEQDMTLEVINTVTSSGMSDPGERPKDQITPDPEWIDAPKG